MIVGVAALLLVLAVPTTGGSFQRLGEIPVRGWVLLPIALLLQVLLFSVLSDVPAWLGFPVHLLTYALAAVFLWLNRTVRGVPLIALGAALNGVTIALNHGTLPASEWAVRTAGLPADKSFSNSGILENPTLPWLGDIFAIPQGLPFANVFSVGDILVLAGVAVLVLANSHSKEPATSQN